MLTKAKKIKTVLIITLKPSLERNLADMIEAIEPNNIAPTIELKIISGIVIMLNPPSVEGWHTGREWIDSSFLIERVNYAVEMLGNPNTPGMKNILERIGSDHTSISLLDLMDACLYELGCVELDEKTKSILLSELGQEDPIVIDANFGQRVGQMMELIVASREFQLS